MTPIKRHCQFLVDKERDKEDGRLRYRIKWEGNTVAFNVGYRIRLDKWSRETQRCIRNTSHGKEKHSASEINRAIQIIEDKIETIFSMCEMNDRSISSNELREEYNIMIGKKEEAPAQSIQELYSFFIQDQTLKSGWSHETIKKMNVIRNHLNRYNSDLTVDDINENTLQDFIGYLIYTKKLRNTTVERHYSIFTWFLRWANEHQYITSTSHLVFKPKFKGLNTKEVIYLSWEELLNLYEFDFKDKYYLERVKDVFCFCCFTGLRYSDVKKLTKEDIQKDSIQIVTQKTTDRLKIELNNYSRAILDKYKNYSLDKNRALPVISNQKMNEFLKDMGKIVGLDTPTRIVYFRGNKRYEEIKPKYELLSTHCGRRTFVVNALSLGIPSEVIMRWTGHSDYKAMKPYVKIVDELKKAEMNKFNRI